MSSYVLDNELLDIMVEGNQLGAVTSGQIGSVVTPSQYTFVFISACEGLPAAKAFTSKCALGYDYEVRGAGVFTTFFWLQALSGYTIFEAKMLADDYFLRKIFKDFHVTLDGDGSIILLR